MASVQKILIVGGGIGGLIAAVALRQKDPNIAVEIVEVNSKWDVYGVGIITLANSLRALATVGLADKVLAAGHGMDKLDFFDSEGNFLHAVPQPRLAGPQYPSANALPRPRLHTILQDAVHAAGVPVRVGVTIAELEQTEQAVQVNFTDDTAGAYDLVIGADGLRSLVRQLVFGTEYQPTFAGQMIWRCNVPRPPEVENFQMFQGTSGNKAGFVPLAPDLMYIFLTEKPKPGADTRIPDERLADAFGDRLQEFGGPVAEIRDRYLTDPSKIVYRPFEEILLPPPWYRGRVVLIGDAAHAMSAHVAQGAAMAIEDAVVLAEEVMSKPTVQEALNGYMERRYERCRSLVEIAHELARGEMENDRTVDVRGLTVKSMQIAAAPIQRLSPEGSTVMAEVFEYHDKRVTLIDLSDLLGNETSDFEFNKHKIEYMSQEQGLEQSKRAVGLDETYWPDGQVWNAETVTLTTHSGTHIDAPLHYGPARHGETLTIDKIPLRWCFGDGVVLNMTHKGRGEGITDDDVKAELGRIGYTIKPYDIVLIRTDVSKHFKAPGYELMHSGMRRSATEWLVDQGVKLIGIDAWGLDRPNDIMAAEAKAGKAQFWESHILGREKPYCQIEKLANLDQIPRPFGFTVMAFPVNLRGTSAAWSRVVAMFEEPL